MSSNSPLNTIVIPVYNGGSLFKEAVHSALNQTYANIEIIVVNDGSKDIETLEAIDDFKGLIHVIHKENGGTGSALNAGFTVARGEYIHWLSHDDIYLPGKVKSDMFLIQGSENPESTVTLSGWYFINLYRDIISTRDIVSEISPKLLLNPYWLILLSMTNGCTVCIPKAAYLETGPFREDLKTTQDYDYWLRLLPKSHILVSQEIHVANRIHSGQGSLTIKNHINEADEIFMKILSASLSEEGRLLEIPKINALQRIFEHLLPSSYELSKSYVKESLERELKQLIRGKTQGKSYDSFISKIKEENQGIFQ